MEAYLKDCSKWKRILSNDSACTPPIRVVLGNESADLDSVVSALTLAYFYSKQQSNSDDDDLVLPVINIPGSEYRFRKDVIHVLNSSLHFDVEQSLIFIDDIDLNGSFNADRLKLVLVDHSTLAVGQKHLAPAVVSVVDHHVLTDDSVLPILGDNRIERVGSCSTLVAELISTSPYSSILHEEESVSLLLYTAILVDTVQFKKEAGKVTDKDVQIGRLIKDAAFPDLNDEHLYNTVLAAKANVGDLSFVEVLGKDFKLIKNDNLAIGTSSVVLPIKELFDKSDNLAEEFEQFCGVKSIDVLVILCACHSPVVNEIRRQLAVYSKSDVYRDQVVDVLFVDDKLQDVPESPKLVEPVDLSSLLNKEDDDFVHDVVDEAIESSRSQLETEFLQTPIEKRFPYEDFFSQENVASSSNEPTTATSYLQQLNAMEDFALVPNVPPNTFMEPYGEYMQKSAAITPLDVLEKLDSVKESKETDDFSSWKDTYSAADAAFESDIATFGQQPRGPAFGEDEAYGLTGDALVDYEPTFDDFAANNQSISSPTDAWENFSEDKQQQSMHDESHPEFSDASGKFGKSTDFMFENDFLPQTVPPNTYAQPYGQYMSDNLISPENLHEKLGAVKDDTNIEEDFETSQSIEKEGSSFSTEDALIIHDDGATTGVTDDSMLNRNVPSTPPNTYIPTSYMQPNLFSSADQIAEKLATFSEEFFDIESIAVKNDHEFSGEQSIKSSATFPDVSGSVVVGIFDDSLVIGGRSVENDVSSLIHDDGTVSDVSDDIFYNKEVPSTPPNTYIPASYIQPNLFSSVDQLAETFATFNEDFYAERPVANDTSICDASGSVVVGVFDGVLVIGGKSSENVNADQGVPVNDEVNDLLSDYPITTPPNTYIQQSHVQPGVLMAEKLLSDLFVPVYSTYGGESSTISNEVCGEITAALRHEEDILTKQEVEREAVLMHESSKSCATEEENYAEYNGLLDEPLPSTPPNTYIPQSFMEMNHNQNSAFSPEDFEDKFLYSAVPEADEQSDFDSERYAFEAETNSKELVDETPSIFVNEDESEAAANFSQAESKSLQGPHGAVVEVEQVENSGASSVCPPTPPNTCIQQSFMSSHVQNTSLLSPSTLSEKLPSNDEHSCPDTPPNSFMNTPKPGRGIEEEAMFHPEKVEHELRKLSALLGEESEDVVRAVQTMDIAHVPDSEHVKKKTAVPPQPSIQPPSLQPPVMNFSGLTSDSESDFGVTPRSGKLTSLQWEDDGYPELLDVYKSSDETGRNLSDSTRFVGKQVPPLTVEKNLAAELDAGETSAFEDDHSQVPDSADERPMSERGEDLEWENDTPVASPQRGIAGEWGNAESENADEGKFKTVTIGGVEHKVDVMAVEPYRSVLSHGGYYGDGLNAVLVFAACYLPSRSEANYQFLMDNLFLHTVSVLDAVVADDYVIVFFQGGATSDQMPSFSWLRKCYKLIDRRHVSHTEPGLDRRLCKNLKRLLLVHSSLWLKTVITMSKPFISSKFSKKISFIQSLDELASIVPLDQLSVPDMVVNYDKTKHPGRARTTSHSS